MHWHGITLFISSPEQGLGQLTGFNLFLRGSKAPVKLKTIFRQNGFYTTFYAKNDPIFLYTANRFKVDSFFPADLHLIEQFVLCADAVLS